MPEASIGPVDGLLEDLLVATRGRDKTFVRRCRAVRCWHTLFEHASEHGVAGLLFRRVERLEVDVSEGVRREMLRRLAVDRLWYQRLVADLQRVLGAFGDAGLHVVSLKGPLLSERLYSEPELRASGDLDLLVRPTEVARAQAVLEGLGYRQHPNTPQHAAVFEHQTRATVDLHHRASGGFGTALEAESFVANSVPYVTEIAENVWLLSPEDELLYLAIHAARHRFLRLRWLLDVQVFLQRHPNLSWERIVARAHALHVSRALAVTCTVLRQRLQVSLSDPARVLQRPILRNRAAIAAASLSAVDSEKVWLKSIRVFWHVTYHALLGEGAVACARFWLRSLASSLVRLVRRWVPRRRQDRLQPRQR